MKIFVFGSSITSCYWNGAATYYRGIYRNLAALGHDIIFAEPDIYGRQQNRDRHDVNYAEVIVYRTPDDIDALLARAAGAGLVVKHSGVGADDELLEERVIECRSASTRVAFWDVDAPATLARLESDPDDPFRRLVPRYDFIFIYGGGAPVVRHYLALGARNCHPVYNALDPTTHYPVAPDSALASAPLFVIAADAERHPARHGCGRLFAFGAALRGCRLRGRHGLRPVAGAGEFFYPRCEILLPADHAEIVSYLRDMPESELQRIGARAQQRVLAEHTNHKRAEQFEHALESMHQSRAAHDAHLGDATFSGAASRKFAT